MPTDYITSSRKEGSFDIVTLMDTRAHDQIPQGGWRRKLHIIIFEAETPGGKLFDVLLLGAIVISVLAILLESVAVIAQQYGAALKKVEWFFTIIFTVEYILRILTVRKPLSYVKSFFGVIDLLSILPTYLGLFFVNSHYFMVVRSVRLLRVFRVLKLVRFLGEAEMLGTALKASRHKIVVFLGGVTIMVIIIGSVMYVLEGAESGFTSIPKSMYWAIVTLTTVGYGDIAPQTTIGQAVSALVMIGGYGIIAVPTGIVSVELSKARDRKPESIPKRICKSCNLELHPEGASFCHRCGTSLA